MANYNNPNYLQQPQLMSGMMGQSQVQFPYGSNNMLLSNTPYNNYMGNKPIDSQDLLSNQFLKCRPVSSKDEARAFQIDLDGSLWVFTEMIKDASPEERATLRQKMTTLANKIS